MKAEFSDMIKIEFGGVIGGERALLNSNRIQSGWGYFLFSPVIASPAFRRGRSNESGGVRARDIRQIKQP
jgi:hypothetical protein